MSTANPTILYYCGPRRDSIVVWARSFRERNRPDAAQTDEREACSLYEKLIGQMPYDGALVSEVREYLRSLNTHPLWTVLTPTTLTSEGGATLVRLADGSILAGGTNSDKDTYTIVATTELAEITAIRLEVLADPSLPRAGPGRHPGGNFHLTAIAALRCTIRCSFKLSSVCFRSCDRQLHEAAGRRHHPPGWSPGRHRRHARNALGHLAPGRQDERSLLRDQAAGLWARL